MEPIANKQGTMEKLGLGMKRGTMKKTSKKQQRRPMQKSACYSK
ncbi:uncharacterized protein G2W53_041142 [Senna tora]|uniref:Uncharacterized protein n=1 Tax=Senna tora TaxID=362788 RepID=A0A834SF89_9FABA|nr:uncharacterized protein G2W53_041142 [Senna tora]